MKKHIYYLLLFGLIGCSEKTEEAVAEIEFIVITTSHLDNDLELLLSMDEMNVQEYLESYRDVELFRAVVSNGDTIGKIFNNTYWFKVDPYTLSKVHEQSKDLNDFSKTKIGVPIIFEKSNGTIVRKIIVSEVELESFVDKLVCSLGQYERSEILLRHLIETLSIREFKE